MKEERIKTVAIQGGKGAFHEIASRNYFKDKIEIKACETFEEITNSLSDKSADYGLMAIENTVGGSLVSNYSLLKEKPVKIIGEEYSHMQYELQ